MSTQRFWQRLRLLPSVMALAAALFVVKLVGLAHDARAQEQSPAVVPPSETVTAPAQVSAADEAETSSSEVDVLTSLSRRRLALDARAKELQTQQDLLVAAEKRVDDKIASLKSLQAQLQVLLTQRDAAQQKDIDALVKTYSSMKPRDAARIFDDLAEDVLVAVTQKMKADVLGAILAQMHPDVAQKLTVKLANRLKPAEPAAKATQVASAPSATLAQAAASTAASSPPPGPESAATAANMPAGSTSQPDAKTAAPAAPAGK